jgi:hypothetical protein
MWRDHRYVVLALLLTAAVLWTQFVLFNWGLDAQAPGRYAPTGSDALDLVGRAELLAGEGGFSGALGDGQRMPGYPLFLSWFAGAFERPWLVALYVQTFLVSLTVPFAFLTLCVLLKSQGWALLGSALFALWIPFYGYSALAAETLCLFFYGLFCYQLARSLEAQSRLHLILIVVLAILVYLDPFLAALFIPLAAVLEYRKGGGGKGVTVLGPLLVVVALVLPWTIWISVKNGTLIPLTATSGRDLYLGTGVKSKVDTTGSVSIAPDLPSASAETLGLSDPGLVNAVEADTSGLSATAQNRIYRRAALSVWFDRPVKMISYGVAKLLHAFGFSFKHTRDSLLVSLLIVSLLASVVLWRRRRHREWCIFFWGVAVAVSLQAFIFFPDQQFKTVVFDFPALLIVVLGAVELLGGGAKTTVSDLA